MSFRPFHFALLALFALAGCRQEVVESDPVAELLIEDPQRLQDGKPVLPVGGSLRVLVYGATSKATFACAAAGVAASDPSLAVVRPTGETGGIPYIVNNDDDDDVHDYAQGPIFSVTGTAPGAVTLTALCFDVTGTLDIIVTAQ